MKMNYDPASDAMYLKLRNAKICESEELSEGVIVDYDSRNKVVGIEFLGAKKLFGGKPEMRLELALTKALKK